MDIKNIPAYELISERKIDDLNSYSYLLKHVKSGAKISILENDDNNKVFYIGFRTPPKDSTGVAHILEHSVLCGSEKFPTKDPFADLCKSSLNTFLNAMTFPDKTVYPVASCNDKDFANLMHVYMDAVFNPNIYNEKKIFMQEGWHYELFDKGDELKINGVVYNEMKGAFSSPDDVVDRELLNSLFPDTAYGVESGGDPVNIPDLTYEDFLEFHKKFYHPSNSYIYLYGNADMAERLNWLDKEYLSSYETIEVDSFPGVQKAFDKPVYKEKFYPIADDENEEFNTYLTYNTVVGNSLETKKRIAFGVIDYALCEAEGSPLKQALIDAGIGSEIYSNFDNGIYQIYYSIVAKNANASDRSDFVDVINDVIKNIVSSGFDKNALKAGLNSAEFRYRESDFGSTPRGLVLGLNMLDSWLYDENKPFDIIECNKTFDFLKKMIDTDYYEKLLEETIINNNHKSIVTVKPKKGLTNINDKILADKLLEYKNSLSDEAIEAIIKNTKELKEYQDRPDLPENVAKIPRLSREDINEKAVLPVNEEVKFCNNEVPGLYHNIFTNKIAYVSLLFKLEALPLEMYPYFTLLNHLLTMLDTKNYSYEQLGYEINKSTGGFNVTRVMFGKYDDASDYTLYSQIRLKVLHDDIQKGIDLAKEVILNTKFDDYKRLKDILLEIKSKKASSFMSSAHIVAVNRANSYINESAKIAEYLAGIDYYKFICSIIDDFDNKKEELVANIKKMLFFVYKKENLVIDIIADKDGYKLFEEGIEGFEDCLYNEEVSFEGDRRIDLSKDNEGITYSGSVQYLARFGNFVKHNLPYDASLKVLKNILSYDFLWNEVRIKGGAYGCMNAFRRNGNGFFVSYRDPNLAETNDVYKMIPEFIRNFDADDQEMTNYIISAIAELDTPFTPSTLGDYSASIYFSKMPVEVIQEDRNKLINTTAEDIRNLAKYIEAILEDNIICVVGNDVKVKDNSQLFTNIIPLINN